MDTISTFFLLHQYHECGFKPQRAHTTTNRAIRKMVWITSLVIDHRMKQIAQRFRMSIIMILCDKIHLAAPDPWLVSYFLDDEEVLRKYSTMNQHPMMNSTK
ncbi:unnamed protein product [Absidia cylindrospora]